MKTSPPTDAGTRILLVDHERSERNAIELLLETNGYQTALTSNRGDAINLIRQTPFDLVIMNMFLPGTEGIGTILAIHGMAPSLKIISISDENATASCDLLALAKSLGASATLHHPLVATKLLDTIHQVLAEDLHQLAC